MNARALFAADAWLPDGWRRDVLLEWDERGLLTAVTPDADAPAHVPRAAGPVLPGMPNLHSHAFQRAMAGLTEYRGDPADSFWTWRDLMYRFARRITPEGVAAIAHWLYVEMLKAGYTWVCEFHYVHRDVDGQSYPNVAELAQRVVGAARDAGIGLTMLPVLYQHSGFGERPPRDDQRRFIETPDGLLGLLDALARARPEHAGLRYGVAPHSLRAVSDGGLRALLDGLRGLSRVAPDAPVHVHVAEQEAEVAACIGHYGARPVQWLLDRFGVDARWCLVHATHVDAAETAALAASGAVAGLCPTTEANLGDGLFPAGTYLGARGRFGIGSDSHVAVDWRAELRLLEYGQRLARRARNVLSDEAQPSVADRLFAAALAGGAQAAGAAAGALVAGRRADCIVLDAAHPAIAERESAVWLSGVVFGEHGGSPVRDVYAGGKRVVENGRHRGEDDAYARYRAAVAALRAG
ncbi:formimidoylglutamate deiminase [Paraburkholderia caballeronis]|uniref:formimidoylglutamate deiminase n=1 Tax=Paraburkholderia caballeronis TaxID=416943 RepID=UPI0010648BE3|nr:formimidoylglutamate deiminase [Paraburkholderia caballeronis]TDV09547.1 formimidoylglutamate deiminase [Paraburkholderia caballeronis]TDV13818.1 formimidoylglutamate deiminase [Paraburkholderia caballeronis]TDV23000.1 formimidoylglutamate deiminase [Paraburkholderia caballeronis]